MIAQINKEKLETNIERYKSELELLEKKYNGTLNPFDIVKEAKNLKSPLHDWFDWDDTEAGEKWRVHQARILFGQIKIKINTNLSEREYRKYLNVTITDDDGETHRVYMKIEEILNDEELKKQIVAKAFREVEYWKQQYEDYREFNNIFDAVKKTKKKLKNILVNA